MKKIIILIVALSLFGCAHIEGTVNSNKFSDLPLTGTFSIINSYGDDVIANKVSRMLAYEMLKRGYTFSKDKSDISLIYGFTVASAGSKSSSYSFINKYAPIPTIATISNSERNFSKILTVAMTSTVTGQKYWESTASEIGWCNQFFVTAPSLVSLLFEKFPSERSNIIKSMYLSDPGTQELMALFPSDTNWDCKRS